MLARTRRPIVLKFAYPKSSSPCSFRPFTRSAPCSTPDLQMHSFPRELIRSVSSRSPIHAYSPVSFYIQQLRHPQSHRPWKINPCRQTPRGALPHQTDSLYLPDQPPNVCQETRTIPRKESGGGNKQVLDKLKVERERGITGACLLIYYSSPTRCSLCLSQKVKAQTARYAIFYHPCLFSCTMTAFQHAIPLQPAQVSPQPHRHTRNRSSPFTFTHAQHRYAY